MNVSYYVMKFAKTRRSLLHLGGWHLGSFKEGLTKQSLLNGYWHPNKSLNFQHFQSTNKILLPTLNGRQLYAPPKNKFDILTNHIRTLFYIVCRHGNNENTCHGITILSKDTSNNIFLSHQFHFEFKCKSLTNIKIIASTLMTTS